MKEILCAECSHPIKTRKDLKVAGKLMQPYHKNCIANPGSSAGKINRFSGSFPMGISFLVLIVLGNYFILTIFNNHPESRAVIIIFNMIFNVVFFGGRLGIYFSYEKYLS